MLWCRSHVLQKDETKSCLVLEPGTWLGLYWWILSIVTWTQKDILHYRGVAVLTCVCTHTGQHPAASKTKSNILLHWQAKCVCECVCSHSLATEEEVVIFTLIACLPASPSTPLPLFLTATITMVTHVTPLWIRPPTQPCMSDNNSLLPRQLIFGWIMIYSSFLLFGRICMSFSLPSSHTHTHRHTSHLSIHKVSVSHRSMCHALNRNSLPQDLGKTPPDLPPSNEFGSRNTILQGNCAL